jgi:hypothetical protein
MREGGVRDRAGHETSLRSSVLPRSAEQHAEVMQMATRRQTGRFTSLSNLAAVCGGLAGVGGITHGVGEVIQGSRSPGGIVFDSWAQGRIARNLGGEPAMSGEPDPYPRVDRRRTPPRVGVSFSSGLFLGGTRGPNRRAIQVHGRG